MNRRDIDALAKAAKLQLKQTGEAFRADADPHAVLAGFLADAVAGAHSCAGFDRAKFLKSCGVAHVASE